MKNKIITFLHIESDPMPELYEKVGKFLTSRKLVEKLGMPILADNGNIWFVSINKEGLANGFAIVRINKSASAHIRFLHSDDENVRNLILDEILNNIKDDDIKVISTNDLKTSLFWIERGFTKFERERGQFCRWSLILESNDDKSN